MDINDISEEQAKKILDFLANQSSMNVDIHPIETVNNSRCGLFFIDSVSKLHPVYSQCCNGILIDIDVSAENPSWHEFLKKILEIAEKHDVYFRIFTQVLLVKKGTCLEEILVEMDLVI